MSSPYKSRISTIGSYGPEMGFWDSEQLESPSSYSHPPLPEPPEPPSLNLNEASTTFGASYPSGAMSAPPTRTTYPRPFPIEHPPLPPARDDHYVSSPPSSRSHRQTLAQLPSHRRHKSKQSITERVRPRRKSTQESFDVQSSLLAGSRRWEDSTYNIPPPPPEPAVPMIDIDFTGHRGISLDDMGDSGKSDQRGGTLSRHGTLARRLGNLWGTVKKHRQSVGGTLRGRPGTSEGAAQNKTGHYTEIGDVEDGEEPINIDITGFAPEFAMPKITLEAMQKNNMDPNKAYTGAGEVIDLSNLEGLDDPNKREVDIFSIQRAGTIENSDKQSYFFPPDRDIPNWKPVSTRTWFIMILLLMTVALIVAVEMLFYYSNNMHFIKDLPPQGCKNNKLQNVSIDTTMDIGRLSKLNATEVGNFTLTNNFTDGTEHWPIAGLYTFCSVNDLNLTKFVVWKYIPTAIGVVYGILWKVTDTEIKRGEPYYQLSHGPKGALAASSLNIEYHTFWSLLVPVEAMKHRQWVVVASSIASLFAFAIVPTILSAIIQVTPNQRSRGDIAGNWQGLGDENILKAVVVSGPLSHITTAFLVLILILGSYVMIKLSFRRSGLIGDPSGIAGVAAMANKSHILMDFKKLDLATEEEIHKQLNKRTYILHNGALWQAQFLKESERNEEAPKPMNAHPLLLRLKGMIPFMAFTFIIFILLPIMVYENTFNNAMNDVPWLQPGLSVIIKSLWEIVEKDMRMLEPFYVLYQREAHSSVLTLDYTATIPGVLVIKALNRGHILLAWVAFVSLLIEILTVVMGSLDVSSSEESHLSSTTSFVLAMIIMFTLLVTMVIVLYYRRHPFLPRQPGTISSVLAFIHQSQMLTDFSGTEQMTTAEREAKLAQINKRYGFGWYLGRDNERHLGIDHELLQKSYKFGENLHKGVMAGPDIDMGW